MIPSTQFLEFPKVKNKIEKVQFIVHYALFNTFIF